MHCGHTGGGVGLQGAGIGDALPLCVLFAANAAYSPATCPPPAMWDVLLRLPVGRRMMRDASGLQIHLAEEGFVTGVGADWIRIRNCGDSV
jgi:hypothetical protein